MNLTQALKTEYENLWTSCTVRPARSKSADAIADRLVASRARYEAVGKPLGIPWYVIGIIHMLESSGSFSTHLHNGDPLSARTVRHPPGRPKAGNPPFTWEQSATDALKLQGLDKWKDWSAGGILYVWERYNGFGYRNRGIHSPYLWSFSNHYSKGKYVADGKWSATAVSEQCGAAVLLARLVDRGIVKLQGQTNGRVGAATAKAAAATAVRPDDGILRRGAKGPAVTDLKQKLAAWFETTSPGEWEGFKISGNDVFGAALERAVRLFQQRTALDVDGEVGPQTLGALAQKPRKPAAAATPKVKDLEFPGTLARNASGVKVRLVQGWLTLHGHHVVVDGGFGPATEQALGDFQAKRGLPRTGSLDEATWAALVAPMVAALTPVQRKQALGVLVVAYAKQHLKVHAREAGGENSGPWVRLYTDGREGTAYPWCAGFATYCLQQACETLGVPMPVVRTLACDEMARTAGSRFVRGTDPGVRARLRPGSFFLRQGKPGDALRYAHTGIVVSASPETMQTIEGNTNDEGTYEGYEVCARTRGYKGMDFVVL